MNAKQAWHTHLYFLHQSMKYKMTPKLKNTDIDSHDGENNRGNLSTAEFAPISLPGSLKRLITPYNTV